MTNEEYIEYGKSQTSRLPLKWYFYPNGGGAFRTAYNIEKFYGAPTKFGENIDIENTIKITREPADSYYGINRLQRIATFPFATYSEADFSVFCNNLKNYMNLFDVSINKDHSYIDNNLKTDILQLPQTFNMVWSGFYKNTEDENYSIELIYNATNINTIFTDKVKEIRLKKVYSTPLNVQNMKIVKTGTQTGVENYSAGWYHVYHNWLSYLMLENGLDTLEDDYIKISKQKYSLTTVALPYYAWYEDEEDMRDIDLAKSELESGDYDDSIHDDSYEGNKDAIIAKLEELEESQPTFDEMDDDEIIMYYTINGKQYTFKYLKIVSPYYIDVEYKQIHTYLPGDTINGIEIFPDDKNYAVITKNISLTADNFKENSIVEHGDEYVKYLIDMSGDFDDTKDDIFEIEHTNISSSVYSKSNYDAWDTIATAYDVWETLQLDYNKLKNYPVESDGTIKVEYFRSDRVICYCYFEKINFDNAGYSYNLVSSVPGLNKNDFKPYFSVIKSNYNLTNFDPYSGDEGYLSITELGKNLNRISDEDFYANNEIVAETGKLIACCKNEFSIIAVDDNCTVNLNLPTVKNSLNRIYKDENENWIGEFYLNGEQIVLEDQYNCNLSLSLNKGDILSFTTDTFDTDSGTKYIYNYLALSGNFYMVGAFNYTKNTFTNEFDFVTKYPDLFDHIVNKEFDKINFSSELCYIIFGLDEIKEIKDKSISVLYTNVSNVNNYDAFEAAVKERWPIAEIERGTYKNLNGEQYVIKNTGVTYSTTLNF